MSILRPSPSTLPNVLHMSSSASTIHLNETLGIDLDGATTKKASKPSRGPNVKWSSVEDSALVDVLEEEKDNGGQSESGWKKSVWVAVSERLKRDHPTTPPKAADKCLTRFSRVCLGLSPHYAYSNNFSVKI